MSYLTTREAADELRVHQTTIQGYIRAGKLAAVRLGGEGAYRIRREDLDAFMTNPPEPERARPARPREIKGTLMRQVRA